MSTQNSSTLTPEHLQEEAELSQGGDGKAFGDLDEVEADVPVAPTSEAIHDAVTVEGTEDKVDNVDMRDVDIIRAREDAAICIQVCIYNGSHSFCSSIVFPGSI